MELKKPGRKSKSGLKKESGRWRPTTRQVLWAIGMVVALVTTALLIANLYPGIWKDLLDERGATLIGIVVALTVIVVLLAIGGASLGWTGFGEKKLWNWLELLSALAIPVVLALAGYWFTVQQDERQREIEEQRAQDAALQAYLDQMSTLLLEKNLRSSEEDSEVRTLARARTLTVLRRLGPDRKGTVVQFLHEASLIQPSQAVGDEQGNEQPQPIKEPTINLTDADLSDANLSDADLSGADLSRVNLSDANLRWVDLSEAYLQWADLPGANVSEAYLQGADLYDAELERVDLSSTDLTGANLESSSLVSADLSESFLIDADLGGAFLMGADLSRADLSEADLSYAKLTNAKVTQEQLGQAKTLKEATMPNGQKYEDWLKSKSRGENG